MAISGVGSVPSLGGPSMFSPVGQAAPDDPPERARQKAAASADLQKGILDQVRKKGLYAWAQEQKYEKLKEQVRKDIMAERGVDDAALAAMGKSERAAFETSLEDEI